MEHDEGIILMKGSLLTPASSAAKSSSIQTFGNIIVSIVGTGVLGLPYAFRVAGWLTGSIGVIIAAAATYYCMLILVECRNKMMASSKEGDSAELRTYGDLGYRCMGKWGRYVTETLILISQSGGATSYLVFIAQNLSAIFKLHHFTSPTYVFLLLPLELALSFIKSLSALAPFSIFADICNILAMSFVVKDDIQQALTGQFSFSDRKAVSMRGLPFAGGMAVFCFEGFGMTLTLEDSMKDRTRFPKLLGMAIAAITSVYFLFGFFGYMAYGDETRDIVTLNLPRDWTAIAIQVGMCMGLAFTFPITAHPVHEILEENMKRMKWFQKLDDHGDVLSSRKVMIQSVRAVMVLLLGILAAGVPGFGVFASLVGSSVCALLSFVLPATFHLMMLGASLQLWQKSLDVCILIAGLVFAVYGTYNTITQGGPTS